MDLITPDAAAYEPRTKIEFMVTEAGAMALSEALYASLHSRTEPPPTTAYAEMLRIQRLADAAIEKFARFAV